MVSRCCYRRLIVEYVLVNENGGIHGCVSALERWQETESEGSVSAIGSWQETESEGYVSAWERWQETESEGHVSAFDGAERPRQSPAL